MSFRAKAASHWLPALALVLSACRDRPTPADQAPVLAERAPVLAATPSEKTPAALAPSVPAELGPLPFDPFRDLPQPPELRPFDSDVVVGRAVVTSVERQATAVGLEILEAGGNAVDAAVATALALCVTHPSAASLGGGGFLLLRLGGTIEAIDFREDAPRGLTQPLFDALIAAHGEGPTGVGVPGLVAGLSLAHEKHGRLPWPRLFEGALRLAAGHNVGQRQAETVAWSRDKLRRTRAAARLFLPNGRPLAVGSRLVQPGLARALERIRDQGPRGFYEGPTAADLVQSLGPQAVLTLEDLARYQAALRTPLTYDYRGARIVTLPPPSGGGPALLLMLAMLERAKAGAAPPDSALRLHLLAEAGRRAQLERHLFLAPPDAWSQDREAAARQRWVNAGTWLDEHPIDPKHATASTSLHPEYARVLAEAEHTTHLSVVDTEGGVASLTVTLSASFGSGVVTEETGIVLNNAAASFAQVGENVLRPGMRTLSSMAPTLVLLGPNDTLVLGTPGGDTIPSTLAALVLRLVDDRQSLAESVRAPRIHQGFWPDEISMERTRPLPAPVALELERLGHRVRPSRRTIGDANIAASFAGRAGAVCDAREGGEARALPLPPNPSPP